MFIVEEKDTLLFDGTNLIPDTPGETLRLPKELALAWKANAMPALKRLAAKAGLIQLEEPRPIAEDLISAFRDSSLKLLEESYSDEDVYLRAEDQGSKALRERQKAEWVDNMREEFFAHQPYLNEPGIYSFKGPDGKKFRSWFDAKQPIRSLRQIAAIARRKYPDHDISVIPTHRTTTKSGAYGRIGGADVPHYAVYFAMKQPAWVATRERVFLQEGKLLSTEDCEALWATKETIPEWSFKQQLDLLIKNQTKEERCLEERGWEEMDSKGKFHDFEEDWTHSMTTSLAEPIRTKGEWLYSEKGEDGEWWAKRKTIAPNRDNFYQWEDDPDRDYPEDLAIEQSLTVRPEGLSHIAIEF